MSHELHLAPMIAGGLALFLFGLELMTASLKAVAGPGLQTARGKLTADRFRGLLAGAFVTALLNSSTITTVLMVGFVSAGLMTLNQTVPLIMGANIGSTIEESIAAVDQANRSQASKVLAAKGRIQELAESARKSVLAKLQLSEKKDVVSFSIVTDLIEQFKQIAHLARQIARIVEEWTNHKATGSSPGGTSARNEAESKQDLAELVKASRKSD
jgi:Na+/phosphate symporter